VAWGTRKHRDPATRGDALLERRWRHAPAPRRPRRRDDHEPRWGSVSKETAPIFSGTGEELAGV